MFDARSATLEETTAFWKTGKAPPGVWIPIETSEGRSADLVCPTCGRWASLQGHAIAPDGTVSPSVQCPYSCTFHENPVRLLGWPP